MAQADLDVDEGPCKECPRLVQLAEFLAITTHKSLLLQVAQEKVLVGHLFVTEVVGVVWLEINGAIYFGDLVLDEFL